jgi:hypothetical protein
MVAGRRMHCQRNQIHLKADCDSKHLMQGLQGYAADQSPKPQQKSYRLSNPVDVILLLGHALSFV